MMTTREIRDLIKRHGVRSSQSNASAWFLERQVDRWVWVEHGVVYGYERSRALARLLADGDGVAWRIRSATTAPGCYGSMRVERPRGEDA